MSGLGSLVTPYYANYALIMLCMMQCLLCPTQMSNSIHYALGSVSITTKIIINAG